MKDLEKIKSEDLGCQVADANPGNFAIEQEVAQLVGATVPAPTEPSADDARELGAQLLVFLRRALTPIQSALRTALAAIYAHLDSRCTDYLCAAYDPFRLPAGPYDPMRPFVPRTLPNLLTAITAFAPRKISNGSAPNDGIPDGTTMVHILGDSSMQITELGDDNADYTMNRQLNLSLFPNASKVTIAAKRIEFADQRTQVINSTAVKDVEIPNAEYVKGSFSSIASDAKVNAPNLEEFFVGCGGGPNCETIYMPKFRKPNGTNIFRWWETDGSAGAIKCKTMILGSVNSGSIYDWSNGTAEDLLHFEFGADGLGGLQISMNLSWWTATNCLDASRTDLIEEGSTAANNLEQFLQNFRDYIADRLADNGSGKTLTLSQAVFSAVIEGASPICNEIKGIIEDKGWKVQDTNNNIFPTT